MSNATGTGRSWSLIERAAAKALAQAQPPRCFYHPGVTMKGEVNAIRRDGATGRIHPQLVTNFRFPVPGCPAVSGVATDDETGD